MIKDIEIIHDKEELYDRCENMEQLFNYYLALVMEYQELKKQLEQERNIRKEVKEYINNNSHYFNSDGEIMFVIEEEKEEIFCKELLEILNKEVE